ncbi:MAG: hypothetical protein GC180_00905 [Bacteroidetes bacterium]|nr:hypothetical protein [Bacteroidota bacterium]
MIGIFYKKQRKLQSPLSESEIFEKLQLHSVGGNRNNLKITTFFKAKFNQDEHRFSLKQIFDMGINNQIRPEILGRIESGKEFTVIHLSVILPKWQEILIDSVIVSNILIEIGLVYFPWTETPWSNFFPYGLPITIVLIVLLTKAFFNSKYSDCEDILLKMMKAKVFR